MKKKKEGNQRTTEKDTRRARRAHLVSSARLPFLSFFFCPMAECLGGQRHSKRFCHKKTRGRVSAALASLFFVPTGVRDGRHWLFFSSRGKGPKEDKKKGWGYRVDRARQWMPVPLLPAFVARALFSRRRCWGFCAPLQCRILFFSSWPHWCQPLPFPFFLSFLCSLFFFASLFPGNFRALARSTPPSFCPGRVDHERCWLPGLFARRFLLSAVGAFVVALRETLRAHI